jgi:hypothetical protein
VLVYAPYNERPLISEHTNTIDDELIDLWGPTEVQIVQSPAWYKEDDDHASCVLLELPGIAPLGTSGEDGETVEGAKSIGR